jgi:WGR domain
MKNTVTLRRIDPAKHMARFYAMDVQPDLFGWIILTKQWGRIGTHGRRAGECHATEPLPSPPCSARPNGNGGGGIGKFRATFAKARKLAVGQGRGFSALSLPRKAVRPAAGQIWRARSLKSADLARPAKGNRPKPVPHHP